MSMLRFSRCALFAMMLAALCAYGCSHGGSSTASGAGSAAPGSAQAYTWSDWENFTNYAQQHGTVMAQVTYQPRAVVFDQQAAEKAVKEVSSDGSVYTLDTSVPQARALAPGSVLFLYGIAIRKVTTVQAQAGNVVVTTTAGDITDLIRDGHISYRVPIDYGVIGTPPLGSQSVGWENLIAAPALADIEQTISLGSNADKCKLSLAFGWSDPQLSTTFHSACTIHGALFVELNGNGWFRAPIVDGLIDIKGGLIDRFEASYDQLEGHTDFDWQAETTASPVISVVDRQFKFKLGGLKFPIVLDGIPLTVEASTSLLVHPAVTSKNAVASGHFSINFSGATGLYVQSDSAGPVGKLTGKEDIGQESAVQSPNAMGFVVALEFPRLELALADYRPPTWADVMSGRIGGPFAKVNEIMQQAWFPIKPYMYSNIVLSTGTFTNGMITSSLVALPPCQRFQLVVSGNVGVGVKLNPMNKFLAQLQKISGPKAELTAVSPVLKPKSFYLWKNGIKCPGDT